MRANYLIGFLGAILSTGAVNAAAPVKEPMGPTTSGGMIAIRAGTLIDASQGTSSTDQIVIIENGKIVAIGPAVAIPAGAKVIDLSGEWVMAGLMDAHAHLALKETHGAPLEVIELQDSSARRGLRGLYNAQAFLRAGFTTIRDLGVVGDYTLMDVARSIDDRWFIGPTIISSGKAIAPFGGQSHAMPFEEGPFWRKEFIDADTPDEVRKAVRESIYYGARVIKLIADANPYYYSLPEMRAAVEEAHRAGFAVSVHVYGGAAADNAIEAGVDSIEHGFDLTDAQLARMRQRGVFLVGTDFPRSHLDLLGTASGELDQPAAMAAKILDRLRRAYRAKVRMAFGPDVVLDVPGRSRADLDFDYLAVWREAGIPPADILKAMTSEAAVLLRVDHERGRLVPGQAADIVAAPGDPLKDIEVLRKIDFVMKNGVVVREPPRPQDPTAH